MLCQWVLKCTLFQYENLDNHAIQSTTPDAVIVSNEGQEKHKQDCLCSTIPYPDQGMKDIITVDKFWECYK